jgi:hypothetical protein
MEQVIEVAAESLEDARREAGQRIPAGFYLWREEVLADGKPASWVGTADTNEGALAAAARMAPAGATIVGNHLRIPSGCRTIQTEAGNDLTARQLVSEQVRREVKQQFNLNGKFHKISAVRLKSPARGGFLGLGKKPAVYEVEVCQLAAAVAEYKLPARIRLRVGDSRVPDEGHCQKCGSRKGRAKRSGGKASYFCSAQCEAEFDKALLRDKISRAAVIGLSSEQHLLLQMAAAQDDAYCWSCGRRLPVGCKKCPFCGKDQYPDT